MASPSSGLQASQAPSFPYFPLLPPELRRLIWTCCLPGPRIVSVTDIRAACTGYSVFSVPPVLLYVNRESRSVALQRYERCFLQEKSGFRSKFESTCPSHDQHYAWVDLKRDILLLEHRIWRVGSVQLHRARRVRQSMMSGDGNGEGESASPLSSTDPGIADEKKTHAYHCDNELLQVTRLAFPYERIHLDLEDYWCGTAMLDAVTERSSEMEGVTKAIERGDFSSLRDVIVMVNADSKAPRREEVRVKTDPVDWSEDLDLSGFAHDFVDRYPKYNIFGVANSTLGRAPRRCEGGQVIELVDLQPSERFDHKQCTDMQDEAMLSFWDAKQETPQPSFMSKLKMMEARHAQEPGFTWLPPPEKETIQATSTLVGASAGPLSVAR